MIALFVTVSHQAYSQCQIITTASQTTITCGSCVTLSAFGNGTGNVAFTEDFDTGAPVGWQFTQSAQFNNPCSPGNGTPHLWMGPGSLNPRTMVTLPLDLSLGGNICFDMLFAVQGQPSPCEGPDEPQEGVYLDYSIDGGATWVTINYFNPNGGNDPMLTNWNTWCFTIPLAAATPNTMIRWHQDDVSDDIYDHWGIDGIEITLNDPNFGISWPHDGYAYGLGNGGGENPTPVCPLVTTTYEVVITDGVTTCTDEITITVVDPVIIMTAGTDSTICPGECVTLDGDAYHQVSPASTPTYENNEFNAVLSGSASVNINVQGLNMGSLTDGSITQVCINSFNFAGTSICLDFGGCPCNGGTVAFGQQCDLTPGSFTVTLNAPDGCGSIVLVPAGVATGNYNNTCFVPVGGAPFAPPFPSGGSWDPAEPMTDLNGCDPNGVWTLSYDAPGLGLGIGILQGWNISFDDPEIIGPVIFSWSPTTNMTDDDTFTPTVCPDATTTYTLTATNQVGCATFDSDVTITIGSCCDLQITDVISTQPGCSGNDGSITIDGISGETTGVTYSLDGGPAQATATFDGLAPGTYTVTVNDDNQCPVNVTVVLDQADGPMITEVNTTAPGCGVDNGTITVTASGVGLEYSADGGTTSQPDPLLANLGVGTYTVVVIDALGCTSDTLITLNSTAGPDIQSIDILQTTCGEDNGGLTITAVGQAPLSYSLDGGATQLTDPVFLDLAAGNYTVTVTDADNCIAVLDADIALSFAPTLDDLSSTDPSCGVDDGTITVTATGPGIQYSIDGGLSYQPGNIFTGLGSGAFGITILDVDGCTAQGNTTLNSIDGPVITDATTAESNCGQSTGTITITATGTDLVFSADNGTSFQAGNAFGGLAAGSYDLVVQDILGCEAYLTVVVTETEQPVIQSVLITDPACGLANGQITVDATGPAVSYSLDGGATPQPANVFTGLAPGNYTVTVTSYGCSVDAPALLNASVGPQIQSVLTIEPACQGNADGELIVTAIGTDPLQYSIDGGTTAQAGAQFSGLVAGTYAVVVTDAGGCTSEQGTVLNEPDVLTLSLVANDPACSGECTGSALALAEGGTTTSEYNHLWSGGIADPASALAIDLCPGTYALTVLDDNGCSVVATFTLIDPPLFVVDTVYAVGESCPEFCDGSVLVLATDAASYQLGNVAPQGIPLFSNVCPGTWTMTVTDQSGCTAQASVVVEPGSPVVSAFTTEPLVASSLVPYFTFTNLSQGADSFLWSFGSEGNSVEIDPSFTFPEAAGEYDVCLIASNVAGCEDISCTRVVVALDFAVHVPNAFSPDGDGLNDVFQVVGDPSLNDNFRLEIFNRWGELIYTSLDITQGWNGGGQMQGVYVWQLAVKEPLSAEIKSFRGHVTLIR